MNVADLMTKNIARVRPEQSLNDAARLMWECDCGALPVLNERGEVCGMITDRDICMATWLQNRAPGELRVSASMSHQLHYCSPHDPVTVAEALMRAKQIRRLPVLDREGHLLGMLSLADIAKETAEGTVPELFSDALALTLADICRTPAPESRRRMQS